MPSPTTENDLAGAHLVGHTFEDCDLSNANMRGATFEGCTFEYVDLSEADMRDCVFDKGCRFLDINMTCANLAGAKFGDVHAQKVDIVDADLAGVTFQTENGSTTAREINISNCNLSGTDVSGLTLHDSELEDLDLSEVKGASHARISRTDLYYVVVPERPDGLLRLDEFERSDAGRFDTLVSEMIGAPYVASVTTNVDGKTKTLYTTLDSPDAILTDHNGNDFLSADDYEFVDASGRVVDIGYEQAVKGQFGLTRDAVVPTCGYQIDEYGEKRANLKLMSKSGEIVDVRMPVEQEDLDTMGKRGSDIRLYSSKDYVIEWQKDGFPAKSRTLEGHRIAALAEQAQMSKSTAKNLQPVRQDVRETPTEMDYER